MDVLDDPGVNFTHPAKQKLILSDYYVFPDLEEIIEDGEDNRLVSASILQHIGTINHHILLKGQEVSGKTALLKIIYRKHHERGYIPLLISAIDISGATQKDVSKAIKKALKAQYCENAVTSWSKLPKEKKVTAIG